jgi:hypothetical protein
MQEVSVEVRPDFLERQAKAQPVQALAELIWNALDADATAVNVDFEYDVLGGMSKIVVADNGDGMPYADAPLLFKNLGGSWKRQSVTTHRLSRMLHGREGRGRFKAFALGGVVDWKVVYDKDGAPFRYDVTILESEIERVRISDEMSGPRAALGVTVVISELKRQFSSLKPENAVQELSEIFAIYLKDYRDVSITIGGERIDPNLAIAGGPWEFKLGPVTDEEGHAHAVTLEVIEWRRQTRRTLYLCNEQGFPLSQAETRFHVGDFHFSAYLKSSFIRELHQDGQLDLAEMVPALVASIEEARGKIKELFRIRAAEGARIVVDEWKEKKIYPYEGEPATPVEKAERQIFDIVAVTVQDASPEFNETPPKQTALHLRLLRHAIERSPTELQRILDEVLKLPKRKQKELAELLNETNLSGIISAATLVADRLKFLEALRFILFDYETRQKLRERSQLHKILEQNTWIFGEEYNLWASDKDLTTVLKAHRDTANCWKGFRSTMMNRWMTSPMTRGRAILRQRQANKRVEEKGFMGITNKWLPAVIACYYCMPCSLHADGVSSSYFCVVEASGGMAYDERMQKWVGTVFRPEGKFVLRLQSLAQRTEKGVFDNYETVADYKIFITKSGTNFAQPCERWGSTDPVVSQRGGGALYCSDGVTDYGFNIAKGRFLVSYMRGYLSGRDNNDDTPAMSGGTCTKID